MIQPGWGGRRGARNEGPNRLGIEVGFFLKRSISRTHGRQAPAKCSALPAMSGVFSLTPGSPGKSGSRVIHCPWKRIVETGYTRGFPGVARGQARHVRRLGLDAGGMARGFGWIVFTSPKPRKGERYWPSPPVRGKGQLPPRLGRQGKRRMRSRIRHREKNYKRTARGGPRSSAILGWGEALHRNGPGSTPRGGSGTAGRFRTTSPDFRAPGQAPPPTEMIGPSATGFRGGHRIVTRPARPHV